MELSSRAVAVLGAGESGLAMARALHSLGAEVRVLSDGPPATWQHYRELSQFLAPESLQDAGRATLGLELLCKSPGIANHHPLVVAAHRQGLVIWSDANLAYHFRRAPIIAITGTNGKTTTTLMVEQLLQLAGLNVFCGGNIGRPCSEIILEGQKGGQNYDVYVWELSSFQLEYCPEFRADYSTILNIAPNHGERYDSFSQYRAAKHLLFKNRRPKDFHLLAQDLAAQVSFPVHTYTPQDVARFQCRYDWSRFQLPGTFNRQNLLVADTLVGQFLRRPAATQKLIDTFQGAEHRLQYLGRWNNLHVYNDAKSTNWHSTLGALSSVAAMAANSPEGPRAITLIVGGKLRGQDDSCQPHRRELLERCQQVLVFGESGPLLATELGSKALLFGHLCEIKDYLERQPTSGMLLFSPGFPSFDQFADYRERGRWFKQLFTL